MSFLWPTSLFFLIAVPVLLGLYIWSQRRRRKYALRYASLSLVKEALGRGPGIRRHIPPALYLLSVAFMLFALARPITVVKVPSQEGTVILAIDVSMSMRATDIKPDRITAAKEAAKAFVEKQGDSVKIGVVSFASDASIVQAPTLDHDLVIAAIDRLRLQRATAIGRAVLTSLDAIWEDEGSEGDQPSAVLTQPQNPNAPQTPAKTAVPGAAKASASIILLTDGQNNQFPPPLAIIDQAITRGIRVYTVGVGTPAGAVLSLEGRSIRTALDETTLKQIAQDTDAQYFLATSDADLKKVYENLSTELVLRTQKTEVTALFTLVAAVFSIVASALSLLWFNRLP
ncbi:MAG TPA: VWA domain-containing protein [Candidatus Saccharimonadales bacterium]|jgi:Ca-activated chloride channel family protein|nr:VWA domain-containing protein [Candidatus Saccharimonadales bacterium]